MSIAKLALEQLRKLTLHMRLEGGEALGWVLCSEGERGQSGKNCRGPQTVWQ